MPATLEQLRAVLAAADALLCARANQMVTSQEWEDLERAVSACMPTPGRAPSVEGDDTGDGVN